MQPYTGPINQDDLFIWQPDSAHARERIIVSDVYEAQGETYIMSDGEQFGTCVNTEDVFRENVAKVDKQ